jgi:C4-dicarboxylate transporter DctQ subunit
VDDFNALLLARLLAGASFTGIIAALGANFVYELSGTSSTSEVLEIPIWIVYLAIPVGSGLMCFRFLQVAYHFLRSGELPVHDHTHVEGLEQESTVNAEVRS